MGIRIGTTSLNNNKIVFGEGGAPFSFASPGTMRIIMRLNDTLNVDDFFWSANSNSWSFKVQTAATRAGYLRWPQGGGGFNSTSPIAAVGEWADYVISYDTAVDRQYSLYVSCNGSLLFSTTDPLDPPDNGNDPAFSIGTPNDQSDVGGPIDVAEFEWLDSPLGTGQLASLYNGGIFKRFQDISLSPSHYWAMLPESSPTDVQDTIGDIDGVGTGTTSTTHPTMFYLQQDGGGPRSQRAAKMRGLSIPRLRRVAR